MSIYKDGKLIAGGRQCMPLLSFMWADHVLNDASWLRADTYSWQSGSVYQAAYQHLADDIDGKTLQSETVAGTTIQFYLADDGHKICPATEESNVSAIYNATGVAWYYIIDTANTRFKLPRTQFAFTGIRNGVGGFVEAGLPNIKGSFSATSSSTSCTGAFSLSSTSSAHPWDGSSNLQRVYNFNANSSSSVYKDSITTVQPKATEMYLYFYVGNFTQSAIENTAGITTEEMNNKVNIGHEVIEFQAPTAANNYTWYRKYADGWVEQGGIHVLIANNSNYSQSLPIAMADTHYTVTIAQCASNDADYEAFYYNQGCVLARTTTTVTLSNRRFAGSGTRYIDIMWQVSGMAA